MIKPTVGRVIYVFRGLIENEEPRAAIITKVHKDGRINLAIFSEEGNPYAAISVLLVQEGEIPTERPYAAWMPYQIGQAKKDAPITVDVTINYDNPARLTAAYIESLVCAEHYHLVPGTTKMDCNLTLKNGFMVSGHSRPILPEDFTEEIGKKMARQEAVGKIWELEAYRLYDARAAGPAKQKAE